VTDKNHRETVGRAWMPGPQTRDISADVAVAPHSGNRLASNIFDELLKIAAARTLA